VKRNPLTPVLVLAAALVTGGAARAAEPLSGFPEGETKPFHIELGGAFAAFDTQAGLGSQTGQGVGMMIDFEQFFGLSPNATSFSGTGWWKWGKKSYVEVGYIGFNRTGSKTLTQDITWGQYTIKANASMEAAFKTREIYVGYRYDFWQDPRVRVSGTIGFGMTRMTASLSANGTVVLPDGSVIPGIVDSSFTVNGPIPLLGFDVDAAISKKVTVTLYLRGIGINLDEIAGNIVSSYLGVKWYFHPNLGVSGGLSADKQTLHRFVTGDYTARASFVQSGAKLFVIGSF